MIILIWTAVFVAALALYFRKSYSRFSDCGVKNPKTYPFFGNVAKIVLRIHSISRDLDRYYEKYPEERFVGKYEFLRPVVIVKDLDLVKRITVKDFEHFLDHRTFANASVDPLFARNLISLKAIQKGTDVYNFFQNLDFINKILWTDESQFDWDGIKKYHNLHYWAAKEENLKKKKKEHINGGIL